MATSVSQPALNEDDAWRKLWSGSDKQIYQALVHFRTCLKNAGAIEVFLKKGGISFIISVLEKARFTDIALSILANCCLVESVRQQVLKENAVESVVRIFSNLASTSIQHRACRALANIALSQNARKVLLKLDAIPLVTEFLSENEDSDCQQTAIRALRLLVQTPDHLAELTKHKGVLHIAKTLKSENSEVLKCTVKALASLTQNCTVDCASQICEAEGLVPLVNLAGNANKSISQNALVSLTNLANKSRFQHELGNAGVIPVFISCINSSYSSEQGVTSVVKAPLTGVPSVVKALCYCCRQVANRVKIRDSSGLKTLVTLLDKNTYPYLRRHIMAALLAFRFDDASMEMLIELGLVPVFTKYLNEYVNENRKEHAEPHTIKAEAEPDNKDAALKKNFDVENESDCSITICLSDDLEPELDTAEKCADHSSKNCLEDHDSAMSRATCNENLEQPAKFWCKRKLLDAPKFCIRSPIYQEVRNEKLELESTVLERSSNIAYSESASHSASGSSAEQHYLLDAWQSSPTSDYASQSSWSPGASPSSLGTSPHWSPMFAMNSPSRYYSFSPSHDSVLSSPRSLSPVEMYAHVHEECYSPVCSDPQSDLEESDSTTRYQETLHSFKTGQSKSFKLQQSINNAENLGDQHQVDEQVETADSCSGSSLPSQGRKRILSFSYSNAGDRTGKTLSKKKLKKQTSLQKESQDLDKLRAKPKEQDNRGVEEVSSSSEIHLILWMLSFLAHEQKYIFSLVIHPCISGLLEYVSSIPDPISRAEKILLYLSSNYNSFQEILEVGFVEKVLWSLKGKHATDECCKCEKLSSLKNAILDGFRKVSESGYGQGVLSHKLLVGKMADQLTTVLSIPYIVRKPGLLQKLMIEYSGLSLMMQVIEDTSCPLFSQCVKSLSQLCINLGMCDDIQKDHSNRKNHTPRTICKYIQHQRGDVSFQLSDSSVIRANKTVLCTNSEYFDAMLHGSFSESTQTKISFPDVSQEALLCVFHHIYNCREPNCSTYGNAKVETLLELISTCDRLLLPDFQQETARRLCTRLHSSNASRMYLHSRQYSSTFLANIALNFILAGSMPEESRQKCVLQLVQESTWDQTSFDICQAIANKITEGDAHLQKLTFHCSRKQ